jgi:hypothetical protein
MTKAELIAILAATRNDSLYTETGAYLEWSDTDERGRTVMEIGADAADSDDTTITLKLTRAEVETLVQRLTATLLATAD